MLSNVIMAAPSLANSLELLLTTSVYEERDSDSTFYAKQANNSKQNIFLPPSQKRSKLTC